MAIIVEHTQATRARGESGEQREPHASRVTAELREAIARGEYESGERLKESALKTRFATNRGAAREALRSLAAEGLVTYFPNRGYIVAEMTFEDAREIYEAREALEGLVSRLFTDRSTANQVNQLAAAAATFTQIAQESERPDLNELMRAKNAFYGVLLSGCGNVVITSFLQTLSARIWSLRRRTLSHAGRPQETAAELNRILEAVKDGNGGEAERAATDHIRAAARVAYNELRHSRLNEASKRA